MAGEQRDIVLKRALERDVHLVRFEEGHIEFSLADGASRTVANDLRARSPAMDRATMDGGALLGQRRTHSPQSG